MPDIWISLHYTHIDMLLNGVGGVLVNVLLYNKPKIELQFYKMSITFLYMIKA